MERAAKYRGKTTEGWVYGNLIQHETGEYYITQNSHMMSPEIFLVDQHSIGQIVIKMKDGTEIYEGDVKQDELDLPERITHELVLCWVKEMCVYCWIGLSEYIDYKINGIEVLDPFEFWVYMIDVEEMERKGVELVGNIFDKEITKHITKCLQQ